MTTSPPSPSPDSLHQKILSRPIWFPFNPVNQIGSIKPRGNPMWYRAGRGNSERSNKTTGRDTPDLVTLYFRLREPERTISPYDNEKWPRAAARAGNSVMTPAGVMLPTLFPPNSVNQSAPSGPVVIPSGGHHLWS
ncbi:hypothetical protein [Ktedonobacter sp. SOSP1-52]|uniref:hypothetical protein n=1 Tax=Ktedonobacter sp. SOSP1-52 TaxID=2778366 RepID=UPI001916A5A7|nr:hypothetical protein [Ktedonobacter sp. SOSP1-52]